MAINWKLVLSRVLKFFSYTISIILVLYGVFLLVTSLVYRPYNVKVTNITSSSATVSWITDFPMTGVVSYKEKGSFLPLFMSSWGADRAYDDRDFAYAQLKCVEKFNEKIAEDVDVDFSVDVSDYDCENIKIKKVGRYYVHHVTIKGLNEKKEYSFRVGDRMWGWKGEAEKFETFATPSTVMEPVPVFGKIVTDKGNSSSDSIVYVKFTSKGTKESIYYSSVTNGNGGWYVDGGNIIDSNGEIISLEQGDDSLTAYGVYKNSEPSKQYMWVFGYFDGAYPDIEVKETKSAGLLGKLVSSIYAGGGTSGCNYQSVNNGTSNCSKEELKENASVWGYGNVVKEQERLKNGGVSTNSVSASTLEDMGLGGSAGAIAGNMGAITGVGVTESEVKKKKNKETGEYDVKQVQNSDGTWSVQSTDPKAYENLPDSSTSGTGQVKVVVTKNKDTGKNDVSVNVGGVNVANYDFIKDAITENFAQECEAKECTYNVELMDIDIVAMVEENPNFMTECKANPNCPSEAITSGVKARKEALDKTIDGEVEPLTYNVPDTYKSCSDCPSGYVKLDSKEKLTPDYLNNVVKSIRANPDKKAREAQLKQLGQDLGISFPDGTVEELADPKNQFVWSTSTPGSIELKTDGKTENKGPIMNVVNPSTPLSVPKDAVVRMNNDVVVEVDSPTANYLTPITIGDDFDNILLNQIPGNGGKSSATQKKVKTIVEGSPCGDGQCTESEFWDFFSDLVSVGVEDVYMIPNSAQTSDGMVTVAVPGVTTNGKKQMQAESDQLDLILNPTVIDNNNGNSQSSGEWDTCNGKKVQKGVNCNNVGLLKTCPNKGANGEVYMVMDVDDCPKEGSSSKLTLPRLISNAIQSYKDAFIGKAYAADTISEGYVLYLPEYGMYSLQLGNFEVKKEVAGEETIYIFYMEVNGVEGFQAPVDPDNPKVSEDIVIRSKSFKINIDKKAVAKVYNLKKGINIVSFNFIPVPLKGSSYSASDLIVEGQKDGTNIEYVSYFEGGRWVEGYKCNTKTCIGRDFTLLPGKGYLIKVSKNGKVSIPAYTLKNAIPVNFSAGWNLVGIHGYSKAYTAKNLIDSINKVDGLTVDNVSWYPTSKGRYEGFQVSDGAEYGFDFALNALNGYFVRVSKFAPKDEACRSIIWHEGNQLHGVCGDSKTVF